MYNQRRRDGGNSSCKFKKIVRCTKITGLRSLDMFLYRCKWESHTKRIFGVVEKTVNVNIINVRTRIIL
jgi:hypothetical protein